jgi:hypothetical protein
MFFVFHTNIYNDLAFFSVTEVNFSEAYKLSGYRHIPPHAHSPVDAGWFESTETKPFFSLKNGLVNPYPFNP